MCAFVFVFILLPCTRIATLTHTSHLSFYQSQLNYDCFNAQQHETLTNLSCTGTMGRI